MMKSSASRGGPSGRHTSRLARVAALHSGALELRVVRLRRVDPDDPLSAPVVGATYAWFELHVPRFVRPTTSSWRCRRFPLWYQGRDDYARSWSASFRMRGTGWRSLLTAANGQRDGGLRAVLASDGDGTRATQATRANPGDAAHQTHQTYQTHQTHQTHQAHTSKSYHREGLITGQRRLAGHRPVRDFGLPR